MKFKEPVNLPGDPQPALMRAVKRLMRPLVRALIANRITFPVLSKLLKEVYVDVAEADFPIPGKDQTDSRITLLTGVHRKDVRVLRHADADIGAPSAVVSRNAQMVATWAGRPQYINKDGQPKPLPRLASAGAPVSFEGLVGSISNDIRARAVLDEWLRVGLVRLDDDDFVHLNSEAFVPREEFEDLAFYFGRNLRDHIAAAAHNLAGETPSMLERAVYYEGLSASSVKELAALSRETSAQALREVNKKALALAERDKGKSDASQRISFGVYFFSRDEAAPDDGEL